MKNIFIAAAFICAVACQRATLPAGTIINTEIKNENGQMILAGQATPYAMQLPNYKAWYDQSYNSYTVDLATVQVLQPLLKGKKMEIFLGSWCGDSRREVPRMLKILEQAGMDTNRISLVFVDNTPKNYKQSPQHEERGKNIHHVPTFITYEGKKEIGRIIESPVVSLEKDMLAILSQRRYEPHYKAISYWRKQVDAREKDMDENSLQPLLAVLKPLAKHSGEFNAYANMLLAAGDHVEAINVLRLNTLLYPNNAALLGTLAEALLGAGNKTGALSVYQKLLVLNPGDEKAGKQVAALKL
jgi:tetratricopeptide (TPR) repeat protein